MPDWKPSITVVGAGGMGALFGSILQHGGLNVTLLDNNEEHVNTIKMNGLRVEGFGGDRTVQINATANAGEIERADLLLFQCKSHATAVAAGEVKSLVNKGAVALSFQNGLGNEEVLTEVLGVDNVLGGLTTMAGCMLSSGTIRDFSREPSYIGEMKGGISERSTKIANALSSAGLETYASENIVHEIWKKLLGNIAMSAVSGVTNLTSAEALRIAALRETSIRALNEALTVAASQGIKLDRTAAIVGMEAISKAGGTGDNKSSLCIDILNRRATEVDFIYGSVIELGKQAGVKTPTLETLASIIKGLESRYL